MRVWALAALVVAALTASTVHAHGCGQFRGPPGEVPPGLREPPDPPPPPPPSAGWKSWEDWWFENREPYLQRKARLLADPSFAFGPGSPPSAVRVRRLERARDRAVLPVLRRVLVAPDTPVGVRLAVLRSIGRCGGDDEATLLVSVVTATEPGPSEVLRTALAAIGRVRAPNRTSLRSCAWKVLRDALRTDRERVAAAMVLGLHGNAAVSDDLLRFLRSKALPREVARAVLVALGLIGDPAARLPLETLARGLPLRGRPPDESLRACAVRSLGLIGNDKSIPLLVRILGPMGASEQVLSASALALGEFPHARHVVPILQELSLDYSKRPQLAHCAALALGRFEQPEVVTTLLSVLENGRWEAFDFAAMALAMRVARDYRKDSVRPAEVRRIRIALRDSKKLHPYTAGIMRALARDPEVGREICGELPRRLYGNRQAQYRAEVAEILGQRRLPLVRMLEQQVRTCPGTDLTVSTVRAFAALGPIDVKRLLRDRFLMSHDRKANCGPLKAAGYTADPTAIPFLIEVLLDTDHSWSQRAAAADALGRIADVRLTDPFVRIRRRSPFPANFLLLDEPAWN